MIVVIDTSSLLSLVRYYLPFDNDNILYNFIKDKVENKEIIILDKVFDESKFQSKSIIIEKLDFIENKKNHIKTTEILPTRKFFNQLENQFINGSAKNKLSEVEFENRKNDFLESADCKLVLYSINNKNLIDELFIVTEESESNNDNKSFKKIPAICKILDLNCLTLPELLEKYSEIKIEFK